jgi:hypothetical protein
LILAFAEISLLLEPRGIVAPKSRLMTGEMMTVPIGKVPLLARYLPNISRFSKLAAVAGKKKSSHHKRY